MVKWTDSRSKGTASLVKRSIVKRTTAMAEKVVAARVSSRESTILIVPWKGGRVLVWDATYPIPWPLPIQHLQQGKLGSGSRDGTKKEGEILPS